MSNTRRASAGAGYRVERYMSNPVYAAGRALPLSVVADKAELQGDERKRGLLYFLQMRSIEPGGLRKVADEFIEQFKWRFGTATMRQIGCKPGMVLTAEQVRTIREELGFRPEGERLVSESYLSEWGGHDHREVLVLPYDHVLEGGFDNPAEWQLGPFHLKGETFLPAPSRFAEIVQSFSKRRGRKPDAIEELYSLAYRDRLQHAAQFPDSYPAEAFINYCLPSRAELEGALVEICVNPLAVLAFHNEPDQAAAEYEERVRIFCEPEESEQEAADRDMSFRRVQLSCLPDFIDALVEYRRQWSATPPTGFVETAISRQIAADIKHAERTKRIVLVQINEGSGKSMVAEAECRRAAGMVRRVNLKGITHKSGFFQAIAKAMGIGLGSGLSATRLQNKIESALQKTKLTILIDEAHNLFSATDRVRTRPELLDWVYTALTNEGVPVVLLCTPTFGARLRRAEAQVDTWNSRQFKRRVTRATAYPERPEEQDFAAVATSFFPELTVGQRRLIVGYAFGSERRLSAIQDVYEDARSVALGNGRSVPAFADVNEALRVYRIPTDSLLRTISEARPTTRRGQKRPVAQPPQEHFSDDADDLQTADRDKNFPASHGRVGQPTTRLCDDREALGV